MLVSFSSTNHLHLHFSHSLSLPNLPRRPKSIESSHGFSQSRLLSPPSCANGPIRCSKFPPFDHNDALRSFAITLQECALKGSIINGKATHGRLIRSGIEPDTFLYDCLVNMYAKCGSVGCAQQVFDLMPSRDVVGWTAVVAGHVAENDSEGGVRLFVEMQREGILPNGFALAAALKACSVCLRLGFAQQLHGEAIKMQLLSDSYVGSSLVEVYVKCGEMEFAEKVFFGLPEHNSVSLNAMLNGYSQIGYDIKAIMLFHKLLESETRPNEYIFPSVIKCCASLGVGRQGKAIHGLLVKYGIELDGVLGSSLIDMYSKCDSAADAHKVFERIPEPDVVVYTAMISCFGRNGMALEAFQLFSNMRRVGIIQNQYTLVIAACTASKFGDQRLCGSIHSYIVKSGGLLETELGNAILNMYMKVDAVEEGCKVFNCMLDRDIVSWNMLLSGFHSGASCDQALRFFNQMITEKYIPNKYTFISILRSCTNFKASSYGTQVHAHIIKRGIEGDSHVGRALLDFYVNCGHFPRACLVFNRMQEKDVFDWTLVITGYAKKDQGEKAIEYYRDMQREGVSPNGSTLSSCLSASADLAALSCGLQFHSWVIKSGIGDEFVSSSLIDMYVKCGSLMDAEAVFYSSSIRDEILWNTMICGYSHHGCAVQAIEAFKSMMDEGNKPDETTFIGVLSACSHAGLVNEGLSYFNALSHVYGMNPTIEHCACMIDILGKAGKLEEAETFIRKMALTHNPSVWQAILGACRMHGNVEIAERAAEKLFELEPNRDSTYVLLGNIYADLRRWNDASRVRKLLSSRGIKKEPGCSWIEVDGRFHVFLAQDGYI
ncbi:Pentatricopeptide repeat-containing protein [Ananas comosus]|uniref:Pentatricopeptide repeat-containing protein n=1 Tax=Ananas comosus TaxID=4615 RepID=A0A199VH89_ANACO|nr:Pentatricopeptide repeat-containing protein [Ananas comosus]